jgi:hypothetical protein
MPIPNTDFLYDTSLSRLCVNTAADNRGGARAQKQADTFLHALKFIRCANALKPFPDSDARVCHDDGNRTPKRYFLFIFAIAGDEPTRQARDARYFTTAALCPNSS